MPSRDRHGSYIGAVPTDLMSGRERWLTRERSETGEERHETESRVSWGAEQAIQIHIYTFRHLLYGRLNNQ